MSYWILYCEAKNRILMGQRERAGAGFVEAIREIEKGEFLVINSPGSAYSTQKAFLIELRGYPYVVPFNFRGPHVQLVTMFPSRRFKNEKRG